MARPLPGTVEIVNYAEVALQSVFSFIPGVLTWEWPVFSDGVVCFIDRAKITIQLPSFSNQALGKYDNSRSRHFPDFLNYFRDISKMPIRYGFQFANYLDMNFPEDQKTTHSRHDVSTVIAENCCDRLYRHHSTCVGLKNQVWTAVKINVLSTLAKNLNGKKK